MLLKEMLDNEINAGTFRVYVYYIMNEYEAFCNYDGISLPLWSLFIGALASTTVKEKKYFRSKIHNLVLRMRSNGIRYILAYLDGVWNTLDNDKPFEFRKAL